MAYHLRRTDREITDPETIERILRTGKYTTIALAGEEGPYAVTLSYGYDSEQRRLYFHAAHEGQKIDLIARDPRACATVIAENGYTHGECEHPFESVVMFGTMRVVEDAEEKLHAIHTLVDHLETDAEKYWESRSWKLESRMAGFSALVFEIERLTAKRGK
jgi:nitroimidazol reductase NimA-like FMN-containing flavoprotein (pyridoxamine 5'-phosphate oxidase superfamily)